MKEKVVVYEKPTCSTCRIVKKELNEKGIEFDTINYFEQPLTPKLLKKLLKAAGIKPSEALRTKEDAYKQYVAGKNLDDQQLIEAMVKHPELIQRPIVVKGGKAVIPRPIENLKKLDF
jgi:arsenate reductase